MTIKLSDLEIRKQLRKLHNFEKIKYPQLKERSDKLREKIKKLEIENKKIPELEKQIETQKLRIEELEAMKFGKKRNNLKNIANILPSGKPDKKLIKRAPESYRRAEPKASEITDEVVFNIKKCLECGENLTDKKEYIHYREDLKTSQEQLKILKELSKFW